MLEKILTPQDDIIAFSALGVVTRDDYSKVILPAIRTAREQGQKINFLFYFGPAFEKFSAGAAWEDFKVGLHYTYSFSRIAVVSDERWIRNLAGFFGSLIPCSFRGYDNAELDQAMQWLQVGSGNFEFTLDKAHGVVRVTITEALSSDDFHRLSEAVDRWLEQGNSLEGLLIQARKFPGWEDLGSLISHIEFIRDHHRKVQKVALVADGAVAGILPAIGDHFVKAQVRGFDSDEKDAALHWLNT